jgi:N-methylhydantoinase B
VEAADVLAIIRNNFRVAELVEMDLRSLVAGCHVAAEKFVDVLEAMGADAFVEGIRTIRDLTEAEMRRRSGQLTEGTYRSESWAEWDDDFFRVPCRLTVCDGSLVFDFDGASPQTNHFFNSKPYIIESEMVAMLAGVIARDLPYNDGIFAPSSCAARRHDRQRQPPAPIAAAHMDVALNAAEVGLQCVRLALAASPDAGTCWLTGWERDRARPPHVVGNRDRWESRCLHHAGRQLGGQRRGLGAMASHWRAASSDESGYTFTDIEVLESWYPILVSEKRARPGEHGAGNHRAGGGNMMGFQPHGTDKLTGAMLGMRRWMPLPGGGGGAPGACTRFVVHGGGTTEAVDTRIGVGSDPTTSSSSGASGGGFGDALGRDRPMSVPTSSGAIHAAVAERIYGVVLAESGDVDTSATAACRGRSCANASLELARRRTVGGRRRSSHGQLVDG